MESLLYYAANDDYCSVCLNTSSEVSLLPNNANAFFSTIVVNVLTPWLCKRCSDTLQAFQELKSRAEKTQTLLSQILLHPQVVKANKDQYINELNKIKCVESNLQPNDIVWQQNRNVALNHDHVYHRQKDTMQTQNIVSTKIEVKIECEDPREDPVDEKVDLHRSGKANTMHIKLENDVHGTGSMQVDSSDDTDDRHPLQVQAVGGSTRSAIADPLGKQTEIKSDTPKCQPVNIGGTDKKVVIGERDDAFLMLFDIVNPKMKRTNITEQDYLTWVDEQLASDAFISSKYKCTDCALTFTCRNSYCCHMRVHSKTAGSHCCHLCKQYFQTDFKLCKHARAHLHRYRCTECGILTNTRRHAVDHYFSQHTEFKFNCKHCDAARTEQVECPCCKKVLRKRCLKLHMTTHTNYLTQQVYCIPCDKKFKNKNSLKAHTDFYHSGISLGQQCPVCRKMIKPGSVTAHARSHEKMSVTCGVCKEVFASETSLNGHIKRKHLNEISFKYECDDCAKRFYGKSEMSAHIARVHMKLFNFKCTECEKVFVTINQQRSHTRRVHSGVPTAKNKMCDVCGKGFTTQNSLRLHYLIHTGEKPHACEQCGRTFRQKNAMRTHIQLVHFGIKYKDLLASRRKDRAGVK